MKNPVVDTEYDWASDFTVIEGQPPLVCRVCGREYRGGPWDYRCLQCFVADRRERPGR